VSDIKTRPVTKDYEAGYEKAFGKSSGQRGRWIWDPTQKKLVTPGEYRSPQRALDAPILAGRFYESTAATDGTDIGSRRRHRDYMKAKGLAMHCDYTETFKKKEAERAAYVSGTDTRDMPERREEVSRAWYERTR
jgi:hypothetical protein